MAFSNNTDPVKFLNVIADLHKIIGLISHWMKLKIHLNVWYFIDDASFFDSFDESETSSIVGDC